LPEFRNAGRLKKAAVSAPFSAAEIPGPDTARMPAPPAKQSSERWAITIPPIGSDLASILLYGLEHGVSDIHLTPNEPPMFRLHGTIYPTTAQPLDPAMLHRLLYDMLSDYQRRRLERDKELDFALQFGEAARFRVNCFYTIHGEAAVFRVIPTKLLTLEALGMPPVIKRLCERRRGLILVTGPTGSGKSTTLAAMVDYINSTRSEHILTIEDPVEFIHHNKFCVINQREVGASTQGFANALRSALREDPDVVLVGEMRDLETISLALTAAETGHLVFSTLHTQSAMKTCDRIVDVFPSEQQQLVRVMFAESFQAIVCQTLVPKISGDGRLCAMEVLIGTAATRSLIREGKTHQLTSIMQASGRIGMQLLDQHLRFLLEKGVISEFEALSKANNPDFIMENGAETLDRMAMSRSGPTLAPSDTHPSPVAAPPQPPPAPAAGGAPWAGRPAAPAPPQPAWPAPRPAQPKPPGAANE